MTCCVDDFTWAADGAAHAGAGRRRRERRLRAYLRYARMSVEMALAEVSHHTAPRGQRTARAREEEREVHYTAAFRTTVPPPEPELFDLFEEPGGGRPDLLLVPQGPQERVQLRTVEHIADVVPMVQILDIPVLQGADQLVEVWRHLDFHIPEQVIEVPKISASSCHSRKVLVVPQKAEQLVEVPTIVSFSSLQQRTVEQIIDIPVPGRGGGGGRRGLQSLLPGQNTTAQSAQIVDIPVPRGQDFLPRQGSTAFFAAHQPAVEYVAPAPVASCRAAGPGGGLQNFVPGQSSTAVFRDGGPGGGVQNFVAGQSSTALGGADDDDELIRRSNELLEYTRREYSFSSEEEEVEEEEEEEEETEQMDLEEQPSRFEGHFRPRRFCASILRGGLCWRGSSCTFAHSYDELHPDVQGQW